ncbi:polysaccharide synthesis protein GtrA [Candidatus Kuenenbacteria bacterium CG23_combo_of_CG06-09_8_20_14_all_36_9]|uniref:GtrA family protein n=1 Tax=Candidatus Kuenenbacteria bacterium CG10_big_fil_rev_8_21_14_0_10_36_11 TaxID=1974618 RepID=A0A2M6W9V4_9BACT|nr:MAG: polysaccharide synthesis protein GtrA [Candidatus Kuenenbacteria bacterium CG23_combo_of_CG06-09_8_20_14_all_36_9]PIT89579.1 MAG: GtrA family protein [Candidatus Kuenenbacteria bacterium CG10_big_fil_rev_8_21_14_0_10_36_11]
MLKEIIVKIIQEKISAQIKQFFLYCIGGGFAFIIDVGGLYVFTEYLKIWYIFSATLSFILAAIFNYLFQRFITFKSVDKNISRQFILFVIVAAIGLLINNTLLYLLVELAGIWYIFAKVLTAAIVLVWNFFVNKKFTFK